MIREVKEIKEITDYKEANELLKNEWELYKIVPSEDKIIYILVQYTIKNYRY